MNSLLIAMALAVAPGQSAAIPPEASGAFVKNIIRAGGSKQDSLELAAFARCLVTHDRPIARMMVLDQWSMRRVATFQRLGDRVCQPADGPNYGLDFPPDLFVYAVAEALIHAEKPVSRDLWRKARLKVLAWTIPHGAAIKDLDAQTRARLLEELALPVFGECVLRRSPALTEALFRTNPASPEEQSALGGLAPLLSDCVAKDVKSLAPDVLRGILAVTYYRLARAPQVAVTRAMPGGSR